MPYDSRRLKELLGAALDLSSRQDREAFLDRECGYDSDLRLRLIALLMAHDDPDSILGRPVAVPPAEDDRRRARDGDSTTDLPGPSEVSGGVIAGRYKLMEEIGEGGMGTVWMSEQRYPVKRLVAVKLIKAGMDSKAVLARFEAERQALALMDHPNIAKVLDGGTTGSGRPFFVMELVKGLPLTDYCDARRLSVRERLELFIPICFAIQHAHQKGVIHRDLKPSNMLVTEHDGHPVPKVIDFGLAKALSATIMLTDRTLHTTYGTVVGTPLYAAPEQVGINALDVDTRTDVYALGVILYELLTGTTPLERQRFQSAAWDEVQRLVPEEEPTRPSHRLSTSDALPSLAANRHVETARLPGLIRGDLDWIVMKALEKDRNRRYETAGALARDIERHLADEPVVASPPSAGYRLRKFIRKHRGPVLAATLLVIALVAGVVGTSVGLVLTARARARAIAERDRAVRAEVAARDERDHVAAEKKRADENFTMARKAVDVYLARVADDPELKDRTDFTSLRKRLLEAALPFYQQFALQQGDSPASRAESGRIWRRLAQVRIESGELGEAVKAFRQARDAYARAAADSPAMFAYRSAYQDTTRELAYWSYRVGANSDARQYHAESVLLAERLLADFPAEPDARFGRARVAIDPAIDASDYGPDRSEEGIRDLRALVSEHPADVRYRMVLSQAVNILASKYRQAGRRREAEQGYSESVAIDRELFRLRPSDPGYRHSLANALFNYGAFYDSDRPAQALPLRQEAGELLRQLVQDFPSNVRFRHMLARNQDDVGDLLARLGHPNEAEPAFREAVLLIEQLPESYPFPQVHRWRRADFTKDLAAVLDRQGRREEAGRLAEQASRLLTGAPFAWGESGDQAGMTLRECLELMVRSAEQRGQATEARKKVDDVRAILRSRKEADLLPQVGVWMVSDGRVEEAVADAEAVAAMRPTDAKGLYIAGCVLALASGRTGSGPAQAERYASSAIELLRRAIAAGFRDPAHMKEDSDLKALRDRPEFRQLISDLGPNSPQSPAAKPPG
jgi:serine/threonine protein kinase/tetratricopeptide (TPR) repeat protein